MTRNINKFKKSHSIDCSSVIFCHPVSFWLFHQLQLSSSFLTVLVPVDGNIGLPLPFLFCQNYLQLHGWRLGKNIGDDSHFIQVNIYVNLPSDRPLPCPELIILLKLLFRRMICNDAVDFCTTAIMNRS